METYQPLLARWLLELTLSLGWYKKAKARHRWIIEDEDFLIITGIKIENSEENGTQLFTFKEKTVKHTDGAIRRILNSRLAHFRKQTVSDDGHLLKNIDLLGDVIGLNHAERAILCFVASLHVFPSFKNAIGCASHKVSLHEVGAVIAHLFGQNEADVFAGLHQESTLIATGIIELEMHGSDLEEKLSLLSGLSSLLTMEHENADALVGRFLKRAGETGVRLENFPHLAQDAKVLGQYLARSIQEREHGTNVLLYGIPGTGKTEFVKAMSMALGADLYEISFSDEDGDPITGKARLMAFNLCQRFLRQKSNALLMFDEIEDIFPGNSGLLALFGIEGNESGGKSYKAWINRTLERAAQRRNEARAKLFQSINKSQQRAA